MKNVEMRVEDQRLIITIDLTADHGPSSSGKTTIVATTGGNVAVPGREDVKAGINIYKPRK